MEIGIIGGGLAGMAAADVLIDHNHEVSIFEVSNQLGGLASSFDFDGESIPKFYHHVFEHDYTTRKSLERFGCKIDNFNRINMSILANQKTYNFTSPLGLLKFDYLSFPARLRYGLFGAYVYSLMNPSKLKESLDANKWLSKAVGKEVTNKIFYELYANNKFGIPLSDISAKQFANRMKAKEFLGNFGYPKLGLDTWVKRFQSSLEKRGVKINLGQKITSLKDKVITTKKKEEFDIVINTAPTPAFLSFADLPNDYRTQLLKIKYCPVVSVIYKSEEFVNDFYWNNLLREHTHVLLQHSMINDRFQNKVGWVSKYGGSINDFKLTDEQISKKYLRDLYKYSPKTKIVSTKVFRQPYASPIYDVNYPKYMPRTRTPYKWLFNAGIAITYPKIRNMNTALESGINTAKLILESFK
jgi:protoporphyrinogen oxidase